MGVSFVMLKKHHQYVCIRFIITQKKNKQKKKEKKNKTPKEIKMFLKRFVYVCFVHEIDIFSYE